MVRGQVDSWTNNCSVRAGIGDEVGGGLSVVLGWTGGGCPTNGPFAEADGVILTPQTDCDFGDDWFWLKPSTLYTVTLTVQGDTADLSVEGVGNTPAKTEYQGPYTTLWVGNTGRGDWPECSGKIDSMMIEPLD